MYSRPLKAQRLFDNAVPQADRPKSMVLSPSTTAMERSHSKSTQSTRHTIGTATTFLPELHSTPPMPTFQKPNMHTTSTPTRVRANDENIPPASAGHSANGVDEENPPKWSDPFKPSRRAVVLREQFQSTPPLPPNWTSQHDRAICLLDARDCPMPYIVAKLKRSFPQLHGVLNSQMIEKRLRQLDQNVEIDYWRVALRHAPLSNMLSPTVSRVTSPQVDCGMVANDSVAECSEDTNRRLSENLKVSELPCEKIIVQSYSR